MLKLKPGVVTDVAIDDIERDKKQPRKTFDQAALAGLGESMKLTGQQMPITVRKDGDRIVIVDGERRWRAAKASKLVTVQVVLVQGSGDLVDLAAGQLATSLEREDLNALDIAEFLVGLQKTQKKSQNELLAELNKRGIIDIGGAKLEQMMHLVELPDWFKDLLREGALTESHAVAVLPFIPFVAFWKQLKTQIKRSLDWKGSITVKELGDDIRDAIRTTATDLNATTWKDNKDIQVRKFAIDVCTGCEFHRRHGKEQYCFNRKEFDKKNAAALKLYVEKQQERDAKKAKQAPPAPTKAEVRQQKQRIEAREESRERRIHDHLIAWLRRQLQSTHHFIEGENALRLLYWLGAGAIDQMLSYTSGQRHEQAAAATVKHVLEPLKLRSLADFMTRPPNDLYAANVLYVGAAIETMTADQILWLARDYLALSLGHEPDDLSMRFTIDSAYLKLKSKAQLLDMAKAAKVEKIEDDSVKGLTALLLGLADQIGVPEDIEAMYRAPIEAHPDALSADALALDTICIECGCTHLDPCDPPCSWRDVSVDKDGRRVGICTACPTSRWYAGRGNGFKLSKDAKEREEERRAMGSMHEDVMREIHSAVDDADLQRPPDGVAVHVKGKKNRGGK